MLICFWSKLLVEKNDGVDFDAYVQGVIFAHKTWDK